MFKNYFIKRIFLTPGEGYYNPRVWNHAAGEQNPLLARARVNVLGYKLSLSGE